MYKFSKILFLYSLIVSTAIFGWSLFFIPKPENFLVISLIFPISLFFLLNIHKSPKRSDYDEFEDSSREKKSVIVRAAFLITITLFISSLSIYAYSVLNNSYSPTNQKLFKFAIENTKAIEDLKLEIEKLAAVQKSGRDLAYEIDEIKAKTSEDNLEDSTQSQVLGLEQQKQLLNRLNQISTFSAQKSTAQGNFITLSNNDPSSGSVYSESFFTSAVMGRIYYGEKYPLIRKQDSWFLILFDGKQGYIHSQYAREVN